ncbi:hypothetical protein N7491_005061 [Penicillium cf. griseofulvum]|uniref:BTB domain-containing protein n=1 Tax=Penicillium cf. griseofulvum TaxID=2972120 RepID=A0A9W9M3W5_9EURO|nr:hypothetical protein N7472_007755 [Penicillium cf. griseofulvum]KAJ5434466.1 hypothetical protein N7491_005061 [Penicillium cf. griseofulvum]KAJ5452297.1 hypothetical protein N7445_000480 [Penicillium cf. griseofulvum]
MSTKRSDGQAGEEAESPSQRFPKVGYNQPSSSLYELPTATLIIGDKRYIISSLYLQNYPVFRNMALSNHIWLSGVPADIGHTLVHFLCTGAYETIDSPLFEHQTYVEREYERSVQVYHACRKYGLPDLETLAEKYIEYFGKTLTTVELMNSTREAFSLLPKDEIWLPKYVKKVLRQEFVSENPPPNIREIANHGIGEKSELFGTAVMVAVIDILSIQVQQCVKTHKVHLDSLEAEGDTEPEYVAASDAGTGEHVMWPQEPASVEADVVNGLPITPGESAVDDDPGSSAQARMTGWTGVLNKNFAYVPLYEEAAPEEPVLEEEAAPEPAAEPAWEEEAVPEPAAEPAWEEEAVPEPVPEEAIAQEPVAEVIADQTIWDSPLVPNSSLYAGWKDLSFMRKKKRTKKLRAKGLPIPDEKGIISVAV